MPDNKSTKGASATEEPGESAVRVLRQFRVVFNAVKTHFRQVETKVGIGGAQLWALGIIEAQPAIGVSQLARAMDVRQSTASNLVKALVERELVTASKDAPDRRTVQLRILPAGRRVLRKAPGPFAGVLPEALTSLDIPTLQRLEEDLDVLIAALEIDERSASVPLAQI